MNLSVQILIALVLSVCAGLALGPDGLPFVNKWIAPVGTIFINFIKMMIVPVVTCSLIVGVTSLGCRAPGSGEAFSMARRLVSSSMPRARATPSAMAQLLSKTL